MSQFAILVTMKAEQAIIPNRVHLSCRKHVSKVSWLVAPKEHWTVQQYKAAFCEDIAKMMRDDGSAPGWVRRVAAAEAVIRKLNFQN